MIHFFLIIRCSSRKCRWMNLKQHFKIFLFNYCHYFFFCKIKKCISESQTSLDRCIWVVIFCLTAPALRLFVIFDHYIFISPSTSKKKTSSETKSFVQPHHSEPRGSNSPRLRSGPRPRLLQWHRWEKWWGKWGHQSQRGADPEHEQEEEDAELCNLWHCGCTKLEFQNQHKSAEQNKQKNI